VGRYGDFERHRCGDSRGGERGHGCEVSGAVKWATPTCVTLPEYVGASRRGRPSCSQILQNSPFTSPFPLNPPRFGHDHALNQRFRSHRGVVVRFRRVVVARRSTQHHLRRVMVETPPRAGPSPPHGPARFLCPHVPPHRRLRLRPRAPP
jgi:hypothetical protein